MLGFGVGERRMSSVGMETSCKALLRELQHIWTEIGESESDKDRMLMDIERECLEVYRKKVDEANDAKARLHREVAAKEAELTALMATLGEHPMYSPMEKRLTPLKEQLSLVIPILEDMRLEKEERIKQFIDIQAQIDRIHAEITGLPHQNSNVASFSVDEHNLSMLRLNEYQAHLRTLQKDKSDRLRKVLEGVNDVHSLCCVLGLDFAKTVNEVHPYLHENGSKQDTNISNNTLDGLSSVIMKLKTEKKLRFQKLQETVESLFKLWNLMDSTNEERRRFARVTCICELKEKDITSSGLLSTESIKQTEAEVARLTKLKASRMKELVFRRRLELEEICRRAHIEPDVSTVPEKTTALIDSGLVDSSELLANIETQIIKAKEESIIRRDIMDRIDKWLAVCEEENWLEDYNQDSNRYHAGRGAHLNLKRAEKARLAVMKIPAIVDNLISKTFAWEDERNIPFLYDGVRLVSILEDYKLTILQKEEEKRRQRDQKKLQNLLLTEKELMYGSKPSPKRCNSFNRKASGYHVNGSENGFTTPTSRRLSVSSATPELLTPRSYSSRYHGYFKETRHLSTTPLNFVALSKDDNTSSFTSISGSEPESPLG
ncbi:65-kDa microtubule-associated protein 6-like [Dioscorea cayenensis subsp. rotundata]|uniref:65-kDa microtubule-associated protein 6-like n=1 Tax=Dioscorea cayennensis subsp. rotundata TaxID=55577 RepID=A0AB40D4F4_DIOCR|nr:65-kDa microtubule-associated protein 6-like [Dioscorea cayenensis subsp. rotundata]